MSGVIGVASGQRSGLLNDRLPLVPQRPVTNTGTSASSANGSSTDYTFQGINYSCI